MLLWLDIPYVFPLFTLCFPPPCIPMPVCSPLVTFPICLSLVFFHTYIRLVNHVCFCSSYIDYYCQSPTCIWLKSQTSQYFLASGTIWLSNLCLSTSHKPRNYFCGTLWFCDFPMVHWECMYLHTFKILGLWQKAGTVHKLKPLSRTPSYLETTRPNLCIG